MDETELNPLMDTQSIEKESFFKSIEYKLLLAVFISLIASALLGAPLLGYVGRFIPDTSLFSIIEALYFTIIPLVMIFFVIRILVIQRLKRLITAITKIADGDLREKIENHSKDEIGQLTDTFNEMAEKLNVLIQSVSQRSLQVAGTSEQLTVSTEQNSKAIYEMSESVQEISDGATTQLSQIQLTSNAIREIKKTLEVTSNRIEQASASSQQASKLAQAGEIVVTETIQIIGKLDETVNDTADAAKTLESQFNKIVEAMELITDISQQTNLLSLNAAIEAAQAGEHSRGFVVVADEVGKLAKHTNSSAQQISTLIKENHRLLSTVIDKMALGTLVVKEGVQKANEAGHSFSQIQEAVHRVDWQILEINSDIENMSQSTYNSLEMIESVVDISKMTAGKSGNVATVTQDSYSFIEKTAASALHLSRAADELQNKISVFVVK